MTELELFVHTAELNSMSKAAELLGLSNPAASRGKLILYGCGSTAKAGSSVPRWRWIGTAIFR